MRSTWLLPCLLSVCAFAGCLPTKSDVVTCHSDSECLAVGPGLKCDVSRYVCVCAGPFHEGCRNDRRDGSIDIGNGQMDAPGVEPLDAAVGEANPDPVDTPAADAPAVDAVSPDAPGTCGSSADCTDPAKAFCAGGVCVGCHAAGASACAAPTSMCDPASGRCVECTADSQCTAVAPICDRATKACAPCSADLQCQIKDATLPACRSDGQCVQCTAAASTACAGATPACDTTGNICVECTSSASCGGARPICGKARTCQACAADADCAALGVPDRSACSASGACVQCTATSSAKCTGSTAICDVASETCVQCLSHASCTGTTPICATATHRCTGCTLAADCSGFAGHTACAASGACVQCTDNTTCTGTTPICATATSTCRKCGADSECSAMGPGVCLPDGHCATDAETVYVGTLGTATCSESNTGSSQAPVCSLQNGVSLAKSGSKAVVVVRGALSPATPTLSLSAPLTIVGKAGGTITASAGGDAMTITSGDLSLRHLTIQGTASPATGMGINVIAGSTVSLHIDTCAVKNNPGGGILLNGAAFEIKNTTITGNGPGIFGGTSPWGGMLVNNPPSAGPLVLDLVTIQSNDNGGLSCSAAIQGTGVLSTGNTNAPLGQIAAACAVTGCPAAGTSCGAQSLPQ